MALLTNLFKNLLTKLDWIEKPGDNTILTIPDLMLKIYNRKSKLDNIFEAITYSLDMTATWDASGISGRAYDNFHSIEN